ncbi:diphthine synthase [archaeon]|jgi:diphthine synthase|nr:diphthine synthase [archaeon]
MLYLIGLGLNLKGISLEGIEAIRKCKKVYLESYTVEFPYSTAELEKVLGVKVCVLGREDVEGDRLVEESRKSDVGLLVYGCPLFATTHMSLIEGCGKVEIIYAASVFDGIASSGLQLYKFGKVSSMPKWAKGFEPVSFLDYVKENLSIGAHSLILVDIGLKFSDAVSQLVDGCSKSGVDLKNVVVCSRVGSEEGKIFYVDELKDKGLKGLGGKRVKGLKGLEGKKVKGLKGLEGKKVKAPFCFVIPGKMHFMEEEVLKSWRV